MREIENIVEAYHDANAAGRRVALATVVHVEGSSYRRPGARMLVIDDGRITGAISGGCLEGDALRKALFAIERQENGIAVYDMTDEDNSAFGIQLGCNGIVRILFEPIDAAAQRNVIHLLEKALEHREDCVLGTLFSLHPEHLSHPGTCFFRRGKEVVALDAFPANLSLAEETELLKHSMFRDYSQATGSFTAFLEYLQPPVHLVIAGAGNDVQPLARMAEILGWHITVIDGRATHATRARFPGRISLGIARPEDAFHTIKADRHTAFVLMTHNYRYDLAALAQAAGTECFYIGILGPREKLRRMQDELAEQGIAFRPEAFYGPTGLDLGAETAEEIALSILAEIKAVLEQRPGGALREKNDPIHARLAHAG